MIFAGVNFVSLLTKRMAKVKTTYYCQECGASSPKWLGKCPQCEAWNSYVEEVVERSNGGSRQQMGGGDKKHHTKQAMPLGQVEERADEKLTTPDEELNRVLGGGIVPGSVILIGGEPGIGKSTLLLQVALELSKMTILYVTGEESAGQLNLRAKRLNGTNDNCYLLTETSTAQIRQELERIEPDLVIIDSIQTLHTPVVDATPGSVTQVRESTGELQQYAKRANVPVIIVGHITKEGNIAGPKLLEHMVDTVLQFEGDRHYSYRILRTAKNRFGSTAELGIYEMNESGLRQVTNPSEILLSQRNEQLSGIAVASTVEGIRPLLVETQALVAPAVYGTPQRTATGFDLRRLHMLLAVLEKRSGFQFGTKDVFLNIAGGIKVDDPATDLALVVSLLSSWLEEPVPASYCFAGEVGLSGEVRAVPRIGQRVAEADKLGLQKIFISAYNTKSINASQYDIEVISLHKVSDLLNHLFKG